MADANAILLLLSKGHGSLTVGGILSGLGMGEHVAKRTKRARVLAALAVLQRGGLAELTWPKEDKAHPGALFHITPAGRAFLKDGKKLPCCRRGKLDVPPPADTLQQRFWSAMRILRKFTVPELIGAAAKDESPRSCRTRAYKFLDALRSAGVVTELRVRGDGFKRFALVRDLGPHAPAARADHLLDHNTRETIPFATTEAKL